MKNGRRGQEMKTFAKQTTGQSLVEFALVIPILLLLLVGIMEFSRGWMARNILTGAAREAARVAAVDDTGGGAAAGEARGRAVLSSAGLIGGDVDVVFGGGAFGTVTATASYDFPVSVAGFVPGWGSASIIPLSSTTTMRREY
jgi:Flp pilus assembly protein TadG